VVKAKGDLTVTVSGSHAKEAVECYTISE
jgi:hypothetical protein